MRASIKSKPESKELGQLQKRQPPVAGRPVPRPRVPCPPTHLTPTDFCAQVWGAPCRCSGQSTDAHGCPCCTGHPRCHRCSRQKLKSPRQSEAQSFPHHLQQTATIRGLCSPIFPLGLTAALRSLKSRIAARNRPRWARLIALVWACVRLLRRLDSMPRVV